MNENNRFPDEYKEVRRQNRVSELILYAALILAGLFIVLNIDCFSFYGRIHAGQTGRNRVLCFF